MDRRRGWADRRVEPYGPLLLDPAAAVLHYGQEIFEGLKAYRHADGSVWTFRPWANAARFMASARRLALPELAEADFLGSIEALVTVDGAWVPGADETSLYLRPFMFAAESFLGVRPARRVDYLLIASPVGPVLRRRRAAGLDLGRRGLPPRRAGRDGRGQVRRQLRGEPAPAAGGLRRRAASRSASSTPRPTRWSRSSAG